jgi:hypothetical protein
LLITETLRKWVRQDKAERDDRVTSKDAVQLKRLREENAKLKPSALHLLVA